MAIHPKRNVNIEQNEILQFRNAVPKPPTTPHVIQTMVNVQLLNILDEGQVHPSDNGNTHGQLSPVCSSLLLSYRIDLSRRESRCAT